MWHCSDPDEFYRRMDSMSDEDLKKAAEKAKWHKPKLTEYESVALRVVPPDFTRMKIWSSTPDHRCRSSGLYTAKEIPEGPGVAAPISNHRLGMRKKKESDRSSLLKQRSLQSGMRGWLRE
jgi:hypothetical protein